jgi:hypothetical protein
MGRIPFPISIAIPAYGRCSELVELLQSIYDQSVLPAEITLCEDMSPQRDSIRAIAESWKGRFAAESCTLNYQENECNLGYDGNVRRVIHASHTPWVMLMGNDDLLLPGCIASVAEYLAAHPGERMISRSFLMFKNNLHNVFGVSRLSLTDHCFTLQNSASGIYFRTCGFVGGLIVNREWAEALATEQYDGTLYYQIYLAAVAYCQSGIGYISRVIVGGRVGNPPLFGSASAENDVHIPGAYTPKGRAAMWAAVLQIAQDIGTRFNVDLTTDMRKELEVRQSFHIFEMMAGASRQKLKELRQEFVKLELFHHPVPRTLYAINLLLGARVRIFYRTVRALRGVNSALRNVIGKII